MNLSARITVLVGALTVVCAACSSPVPASRAAALESGTLVDLSHEYSEASIFWPTAEGFRLEKVADGVTPGGYYYAANNFAGAEHGGTHLDAPVHFAAGRWTVEQIPLDRLIGAAVVVDVSSKAAAAARLPGDSRRPGCLGAGKRGDRRQHDGAVPDRLLETVARCGDLSRHN